MPSLFTEDTYEQAIIELFQNMGYDHLYAPDMERDYSSPLLDAVLRDSLVRINLGLPVEAINEAITKLKNFDTGSLLQKNIIFMEYLQNGITVKFFVKGEERSSIHCPSLLFHSINRSNPDVIVPALFVDKSLMTQMTL